MSGEVVYQQVAPGVVQMHHGNYAVGPRITVPTLDDALVLRVAEAINDAELGLSWSQLSRAARAAIVAMSEAES